MEKNNLAFSFNIRNFIAHGDDVEKGIPKLKEIISGYSCPINPEIEHFFKANAIEFTKRSQSVTYLVFSGVDKVLLGYFALAVKVISVKKAAVSNSVWKKLLRTGEVNCDGSVITTPAYLIAQLGKNFAEGLNFRVTGSDLLKLAWEKALQLQYMAGGVAAFVEAEDREELANFYRENGFARFEVKASSIDDKLVQYLRVL